LLSDKIIGVIVWVPVGFWNGPLNEYIRHLNSRTEKISPNFSQDLSHKKSNKSKNKHSLTRDNYNFQLYRDGVHPHPELARTWMRKLAVKIRDECWC
jgi:hypothetical protein